MVLPDGTLEAEAFDATLLQEWESVSKIIVFEWRSCGYFPIQHSLLFMEQCIFGKSSASLVNAFFEVIAEDETATLKNALSDFPSVDHAP